MTLILPHKAGCNGLVMALPVLSFILLRKRSLKSFNSSAVIPFREYVSRCE